MGCVSSNSSDHRQPDNQVNNPNHHFDTPSNTKHAIDDVITRKHEENRGSVKTLDGYDELIQRISSNKDVKSAIQEMTDSVGEKDDENEHMGNMDLQKVASLRQWLQAPSGGGGGAGAGAAADHTTPKFGFSFYDTNKASNNTHMPKVELGFREGDYDWGQ